LKISISGKRYKRPSSERIVNGTGRNKKRYYWKRRGKKHPDIVEKYDSKGE
jgi:hypothetical protein